MYTQQKKRTRNVLPAQKKTLTMQLEKLISNALGKPASFVHEFKYSKIVQNKHLLLMSEGNPLRNSIVKVECFPSLALLIFVLLLYQYTYIYV